MANPVDPVYVEAIGNFRRECKNLLTEFEKLNTEHFPEFVTVWKANKFSYLYERYYKYGHGQFFKEDSLQIAKSFMMKKYFVGGMFLLYGLFFVQGNPKQRIRLQYDEFIQILTKLREEKPPNPNKNQVAYIFAKLLKNDAFDFVMFSREFSMEGAKRTRLVYNDDFTCNSSLEKFNPQSWMKDFLAKTGLSEEIQKSHEHFSVLKAKFQEHNEAKDFDLNLVPDDIMSGLEEAIAKKPSVGICDEDIGARRRRLKNSNNEKNHKYHRIRVKKPKCVGRPKKNILTSDEEPKKPRPRGRPCGKRKTYINHAINNEANTESESEKEDFLDESKTGPSFDDNQPSCSFHNMPTIL